jgi:hypothetical protein
MKNWGEEADYASDTAGRDPEKVRTGSPARKIWRSTSPRREATPLSVNSL